MAEIAVFGGTFDPVHNGHIQMADYILQNSGIDKILFMPNGNPPHKEKSNITDAMHRYNMLRMATKSNDNFIVSDYEIKSRDVCYTATTMRYLKKMFSTHNFSFIIGADSLSYLDSWYDGKNLIKENEFIVVDRSVGENYDIDKNIEYINSIGGKVIKMGMPKCDISSTKIRQMVQKGEDVSRFLNTEVNEYIINHKLYIGR